MTDSKKNLIQKIVLEAKAYNKFEDIEKLVEGGANLAVVPVQPLYMLIQTTSSDQVATLLPKLSESQRQAMLDLDLWNKDVVNVNDFEFWVESYAKCSDDSTVQDFVNKEEFLLYLKSRVNIWTFDAEDPMYPDHDYYFLTDDGLLLIEYSEKYFHPKELQYLIRQLYAVEGVEKAYAKLFKLINDNFSLLQEDIYHDKTERLRDYGFVDYYEARQTLFPFATKGQLNQFIKKKAPTTGAIDSGAQNQTPHSGALIPFEKEMTGISEELARVEDDKRLVFLNFTFLRLINSTVILNNALKASRVELTRISKFTKNTVSLGIEYIKSVDDRFEDKSVFDFFDFMEVFKIGTTLIEKTKQNLKKSLEKSSFKDVENEYFLGNWFNQILEGSFADLPFVKNFGVGLHPCEINSLNVYSFWNKEVETLMLSVAFVDSFFKSFNELKSDGKVQSAFYLNHDVESIDFEAIMISSFISFTLLEDSNEKASQKMGVTIDELNSFVRKFGYKEGKEYLMHPFESDLFSSVLGKFLDSFGLSEIKNFDHYLYGILTEHLNGYEIDNLTFDDYEHVGGPIIFRHLNH